MPAGICDNIPPAQVPKGFVAVGRLNSPLKVLFWRQGKEGQVPVPFSVAEGPADTEKLNEDGDHWSSSEVTRATVVADGFLKVLHFFQVKFVMRWVNPTIPVLCIAMIANGELGKPDKVPVESVSSQHQADPVGPVSSHQSQE